jgi:hypothetical protein
MTAPEEHDEAEPAPKKTLARSLGEFFGHIAKGVKTDPSKKVLRKEVEEEQRDGITLRRTTIEEIELRPSPTPPKADDEAE